MPTSSTDALRVVLEAQGTDKFKNALQVAESALGDFGDKAKATQEKLALQFGVATGAAALLVRAIIGAGRAAGEEAATFQRAALSFKGGFSVAEIQEFSAELQQVTGVADDVSASFLGLLGTFQVTGSQARDLALPILNAAEALKAQGATATGIAVQVGKALQTGSPTMLVRSGIILDAVAFKAASAEERVRMVRDALQAQGGDAAAAFRNTLPGAIQAATNALGDLQESIGGPWVGLLQSGANTIERIASGLAKLPPGVFQTLAIAAGAASAALLVLSARLGISLYHATRLAGENARLQNETLKAGAKIDAESAAFQRLNAAMSANLELIARLRVGNTQLQQEMTKTTISAHASAAAFERTGGTPAGAARATGAAAARAAQVTAGAAGATAAGGPAAAQAAGVASAAGAAGAVAAGRAGLLGKVGQFVKSPTGFGVATAIGSVGVGMLPDQAVPGGAAAKGALSGALGGAGTGAALGSLIPGIGTLAGGIIGGVLGGAIPLLTQQQQKPAEEKPAAGSGEKVEELLRQQLEEIRALRKGAAFDTSVLPGAAQVRLTDVFV